MSLEDVVLSKSAVIERCLKRMQEELVADPTLSNYTHQDALVLNIERACQAAIDLAMYVISQRHLGMPQNSGDAFALLEEAGLVDAELSRSLRAMTGFRNIAVHQYRELDLEIVKHIATERYRDLITFCKALGARIQL
ncbi:MAG: type VII toxin-antitoxin system HepT family RNase toxin [Planctomycetota bacterium]|jgi:uncharacterized protein YutE (UPF0331/DUF86 family)